MYRVGLMKVLYNQNGFRSILYKATQTLNETYQTK